MSVKCWIRHLRASYSSRKHQKQQKLSETTLPEIWKTGEGLQNKTNVKSRKKKTKITGNLVDLSLVLVLCLLSWGAVLKTAPCSWRGTLVCPRRESTAHPTQKHCAGLFYTFQDGKVVGTVPEQRRTGTLPYRCLRPGDSSQTPGPGEKSQRSRC